MPFISEAFAEQIRKHVKEHPPDPTKRAGLSDEPDCTPEEAEMPPEEYEADE